MRWFVDEDGFVVFSGRLDPEEGVLVARTLEVLTDDLLRVKREKIRKARAHVPDQPEDLPGEADDLFGATRADALVRMARLALAASSESGPEMQDRAQVVVHVGREVLQAAGHTPASGPTREAGHPGTGQDTGPASGPRFGHAHEPGPVPGSAPGAGPVPGPVPAGVPDPGHSEDPGTAPAPGTHRTAASSRGGAAIPAETALRLACDACLVALVEDREGTPLDVGRKTRSIPPALRRALRARDRGCRFPGCPETRFVEGHHIDHWAHGGETSLRNLAELCRFHHRLVHEGGWRIEGTPPELRFLRPDGTPIERPPPRGPSDGDLEGANRAEGLRIDPATIVSGWCGERLRLGYVVSCVLGSRDAGLRVKASPDGSAARAGPG